MALFGTQRDAKFLASINRELINAIIDTEIEFFKLIIETSNSNIYGESTAKSYYDSLLLPCIITKEAKTSAMDDYGQTYTRTMQFGISRDLVERADFYPEVGDIVFWDNEYYELDNVDANQYFAGKNPETWPNGSGHGYSVSIMCDAHATRQTPTGITDLRRGGNNKSFSYEGSSFPSFDIGTQQESIIIGENPTIKAGSQFTPSFNWGGGFSSFNINTQQETLIIGKNPINGHESQFTPRRK